MLNLDKLVEIGFTVSQATSLALFFRNIGYITVGQDSILADFNVPENKVVVIDSVETLKTVFKSDTQEYADISTIFTQKSNMQPNQSKVNNIIVYFGALEAEETYGDLVNEFISINANYAQILINSKEDSQILATAKACKENNRLFVAQTTSEDIANKVNDNIAQQLTKLSNDNAFLLYHTVSTESLSGGMASIMANPYLGGVGALYSTITNVTPKDYTATVMANLDDQNVSYYTTVNAVNGGGVSQYGSPVTYKCLMINGEDVKRRYIRFYLDYVLKARSIDFLKKKLGYELASSKVLESMLKAVLITAQTNNLIKKDAIVQDGDNTLEVKGFELKVVPPELLRTDNEDLYNSQTYQVMGYYRDSLTGRKVEIALYIDPTDAEKELIGF